MEEEKMDKTNKENDCDKLAILSNSHSPEKAWLTENDLCLECLKIIG